MDNIGTIISALGGATTIAGLLVALTAYLKAKTTAVEARAADTAAAEARKRENAEAHKRMAEDMAALRAEFNKMESTVRASVAEASALRADNDALRGKVTRLENQNDRLTVALAVRDDDNKVKKEKKV